MADEVKLQHVTAPEALVYLGGQVHPFRPGEPFHLHSEHVDAQRAAGAKLDPFDPNNPARRDPPPAEPGLLSAPAPPRSAGLLPAVMPEALKAARP